jgi:hypothetical protein
LFFLDDGYSASFKFERDCSVEAVADELSNQFDRFVHIAPFVSATEVKHEQLQLCLGLSVQLKRLLELVYSAGMRLRGRVH